MAYRSDYPQKKIGKGNPYTCCSDCGISTPEINGRIEGHMENCRWRKEQERKAKCAGCCKEMDRDEPVMNVCGNCCAIAQITTSPRSHPEGDQFAFTENDMLAFARSLISAPKEQIRYILKDWLKKRTKK